MPGAPDHLGLRGVRLQLGQPGSSAARGPRPAPAPRLALAPRAASRSLSAMPLYEGLGSGGEKTAVVIDLGEAFTK